MKITVIVPAYNEENTIAETIQSLKTIKKALESQKHKYKIIVVNDGSKDDTRGIAEKHKADIIVNHKINMGLGAAVRSGLKAARKIESDIVIKFDADLQHDPKDILNIIQPIINDEADVVYGNRFEKISYKMPIVRRLGNIVFTGLMRWITSWPLKDSQPGIFAVSKDYLDVFFLPGDYNYTQQILIDAYHKGMRFAHVDVSFNKREKGKSFVSLKYPFKVIPQIVILTVSLKPGKIFLPIGFFFLSIAFFLSVYELFLYFQDINTKPIVHVNAVLGSLILGIQTFFFALLAEIIVRTHKK